VELGIKLIHAHSRQAKGRIERVFGTLQDRLVKEMRLGGVETCEQANRFLTGYLRTYNRRFMKAPPRPQDLYRPVPKSLNLDDIFCLQGIRTVNNGFIIKWTSRTFVLTRPSLTLRRQKVVVREWFDGRLSIRPLIPGSGPSCLGPEVKIGHIHVVKNRTYSCCVDSHLSVLDTDPRLDLSFLCEGQYRFRA
jgi:hypothetical protein